MQTRHCLAIALATISITSVLLAKAARVSLSEMCKASDLIAVIEITATHRDDASKPYLEVATARVIETMKGRVDGATFQLDYNNGLACPNVIYARGDRCLIFATKLPTGHLATYNTYFGKCIVTNDVVLNWETAANSLGAVRKEIRRHIE